MSRSTRIYERGKDEATVEFAIETLETVIDRHNLGLERMPGIVIAAMVATTQRLILKMAQTNQTESYLAKLQALQLVSKRDAQRIHGRKVIEQAGGL